MELAHTTLPEKNKSISSVPVRFFIWDDEKEEGEGDFIEADEGEFINASGVIEYERHTVHQNGVSQICLTKNPFR